MSEKVGRIYGWRAMDSNEEVRKMYPSPAVLSNKKHLAPEGLIVRDNMKNLPHKGLFVRNNRKHLAPEGLIVRDNKRKQTYPGIVVSDNTKYLIKVFVIDRDNTKQ